MGIHFRLGPDEPGFIIGGFIADCYTGGRETPITEFVMSSFRVSLELDRS